ncbi:hypothetical protein UJ101_01549 [Flavobacteriaceae bacterium UJ101]|nr:hypothetical protein UJ101_01549 [Flavobacteriaceae bacterium UJ101]
MKKLKPHFDFNRENRNGVLLLLVILFLIQIGIWCYQPDFSEKEPTENQLAQIESLQEKLENTVEPKVVYKKVDPNHLNKKDWISLGFSEKQAQIILKYKASLGSFSSLEEVKQCYVISDEKFEELKPYLFFTSNSKQKNHKKIKQSKLNYFNPNKLSEKEWMNLGFSKKQAAVIIKYKKSLGGTFYTKAEIQKCFVISDKVFQEIEPWIVFDKAKKEVKVNHRDLNRCDISTLVTQGISPKEAQRIINYRNALGGFYNWEQLNDIQVLPQKIKELEDELMLVSSVKRMNVNKEALYILKKHPYITQEFVDFLKNSRENHIKFSSFQEIQNIYEKKQLNKLLEEYLSY